MATLLGIDPGFANLGLARVELDGDGERVAGLSVVRTKPSPRKRGVLVTSDNARRLEELASALGQWLAPDVIAVAMEAQSWPRHAGSAVKVALAHGAVLALAADRGIPVMQVSPQDLKQRLTGMKTASKTTVQAALEMRYGLLVWPSPKSVVEHAADALGAVVACLDAPVIFMVRRMAGAG